MNYELKITILQNEGRMANQLWQSAAVYAYCLEKKYQYRNLVFYPWQDLFGKKSGFWLTDFLLPKLPRKIAKGLYLVFVKFVRIFKKDRVIKDGGEDFFLPPTLNTNSVQQEILEKAEKKGGAFYIDGWLFRNSEGLKKYHREIKDFFKPSEVHYEKAKDSVDELIKKYKIIVGVHVRHGDYKVWQNGKFYYEFDEAARILSDYLKNSGFKKDEVVFMVCSDDKFKPEDFAGLNVVSGPGHPVEDLYALSFCDLIIGSTSTFGRWAAYYGDIPFIPFSRKQIIWKNYENIRFDDRPQP